LPEGADDEQLNDRDARRTERVVSRRDALGRAEEVVFAEPEAVDQWRSEVWRQVP